MGAIKKNKDAWVDADDFELNPTERSGIADFIRTYFTESVKTEAGMSDTELIPYLVEYFFTRNFKHLYTHVMSCDIETTSINGSQYNSPIFITTTILRKPVIKHLNVLLPRRGYTFMVLPTMSLDKIKLSLARKATIDEILADLA